jgi:hypothetical protein
VAVRAFPHGRPVLRRLVLPTAYDNSTYHFDSPDFTFDKVLPTSQRTQATDDAATAFISAYSALCSAVGYVPYSLRLSVKTDAGTTDKVDLVNVDNQG